jgi:caffeoyl-CoA O-methyltransferase
MLASKIEKILSKIENQEQFEQENPYKVPTSEKLLSIGRNTGNFYNILLKSKNAKKILEIGMSTGYSTMWFAEALSGQEDGKIITLDHDKNKIERARRNFAESGLSDLIEIRYGDALEVLSQIKDDPNFNEYFDFVFIDADKERYNQYFDTVLPMVKPGGIIGADNILFPERFQKFTMPYVEHVRKTLNVRTITIPIDNGEEVSVKLF